MRREELLDALRDSPFADVEALEAAAALPLDRLEAQVEEQRSRASRLALRRESDVIRRALTDSAQDAELAESSARTAAHAESLQARSDAAAQRAAVVRAAAVRAHDAYSQAAADRAENEAQVEELLRDIDAAELVLGTSSDAASRMSLSSFALASLFEDVAAHASDRLVDMTAGRYRLAHDLERRRGERRSGLGLKIIDLFTEESRDPRTLSGGEGFMASLALALGMADTVRGAAGGIDLDALFLDEGFGTLDPDALSDVLAVLDRLRTGGRTIGIISHVAELQQAITTRIMVEPSHSARVCTSSPHRTVHTNDTPGRAGCPREMRPRSVTVDSVLVISVSSLKGGVGKTSVALGLASAAHNRGLPTLVVDMDPQADASTGLDVPVTTPLDIADVLAAPKAKIMSQAMRAVGMVGRSRRGHST